jgi:mannose-6-phosphate isomerase-like protein (cupin superfamily)
VRHQDGTSVIESGDAFIFEPGQPHQLVNDGSEDMIVYVIADNPIGESSYLHDSKKWLVRSPERAFITGSGVEYYAGEE